MSASLLRPAALGFAPALTALVIGAFAMGASPVFVRLAAEAGVGPFASAFWRVALALPPLALWAVLEPAPRGATGAGWRAVLIAGLFFAGDLLFWHLSILNTTVANATFLATTAPVWVVLGTWLILRRPVGGRALAGLALCLAGGGLLIGQSYSFAPERLTGDGQGLVTAVFFGGYFLALQAARAGGVPSGRATFVSTAVTAACLFGIAAGTGDAFWPRTLEGWASLGGLALVSQVAGQGLLAIALGTLPAVFSSLVIFLEAAAAAALGWLVLGEALEAVQVAGGLLILAGLWIARPRKAVP